MEATIRPLQPQDIDAVLALLREFAVYEGLSRYCTIDAARLSAALFGDGAFVEGLVAEVADEIVGYTLFFPYFSSFRGERGFYVDDLYLSQEARSLGLGKRMLAAVAKRAAERGFERIDLLVADSNAAAIKFYERLGAEKNAGEGHYKISGESFRRLAELFG